MYRLKALPDQPLVDTYNNPELGNNINGPSLIRVPDWIEKPLGRYYLYFAHHEGSYIRLAYADQLSGPWRIYQPGALHLRDSGFCQHAPAKEDLHPNVAAMIAAGIDGDYPHIASPDVHTDTANKKLYMYFHGRVQNGTQHTRLAISSDGIRFTVEPELLGTSYFRVFTHSNHHYAIALGSVLYRSVNGQTGFIKGPRLTTQNYRHGAVLISKNAQGRDTQPTNMQADSIQIIWTRAEDCPERLLISDLDISRPWTDWRLSNTVELHRPRTDWEGANEPLLPSRYGGLMSRAQQLRDPCVFQENGRVYILYSIAGEQGLAIAELLQEP